MIKARRLQRRPEAVAPMLLTAQRLKRRPKRRPHKLLFNHKFTSKLESRGQLSHLGQTLTINSQSIVCLRGSQAGTEAVVHLKVLEEEGGE